MAPGMSTPFARHCQVDDTVLSIGPHVAGWPWRADPTCAVPVTVGFPVTGMVPGAMVTAAACAAVGVIPGADSVTVATSCWPASDGGTTNDVLSSVPETGAPPTVHRIVVAVGVGLQVPESSVTVPPTVVAPPITGVPTVVNGWVVVTGVKSTVTTAPEAPIELTW